MQVIFYLPKLIIMQILQEQPNHPEANHNLAIVITLQGNLEGALRAFENLFKCQSEREFVLGYLHRCFD